MKNEIKIMDREKHWRVRHLKESTHILDYDDVLGRASIEINAIWNH